MPITLELDQYINLLVQANKSPLLNEKFTIITKEQALVIKQDKQWESLVSLQEFDQDEVQQLKQIRILHDNALKENYFKMYRIGDWLSLCLLEQQRRLDLHQQTIEISKKLERINVAMGKLCATLKVDYKTSNYMVREVILKGLMPDIARMLEIEDLVNTKLPEKIN